MKIPKPKKPQSAARLAEQIRFIVTDVIENELWLDRAELITITEVKVSGDLHNVDIYYVVFGEPSRLEFVKAYFSKSAGVFRTAVAQRINLRRAPKINLIPDHLGNQTENFVQKFEELKRRDAELQNLRGPDKTITISN
ncbi:MAG: 30S ribosome-binding factor RbfA [Bifidobacteriaceae bacterium]|jgi:ribosome-binding factor A|nr:30S ribosome-binding factor RbfA [Bifidobacteriaceae bacterium]